MHNSENINNEALEMYFFLHVMFLISIKRYINKAPFTNRNIVRPIKWLISNGGLTIVLQKI